MAVEPLWSGVELELPIEEPDCGLVLLGEVDWLLELPIDEPD